MIAKGDFGAVVVDAGLTVAAGTGTEQVRVQFRLAEGPDENSNITEYLALTEAALPYTVEKLERCGWGGDLTDLSSMTGARVRIVIKHEEGRDGKVRARVQYINEWREVPKLTGDAAAQVASKWSDKIAALRAAGGNGVKAPF